MRSKHSGKAGSIRDELERRGYSGRRQSPTRARNKTRKGTRAAPVSRRDFLRYGIGSGMLIGLPPALTQSATLKPSATRPVEVRTLFFNFSHEDYANKTYYLVAAGRKYRLTRVIDKPSVLVLERNRNTFLRQVSKLNVTHHLENVELAGDAVQLCYVTSDENQASGTWKMSAMFLNMPTNAIATAHALGNNLFGPAGRPLSAKRRKYGIAKPAASAIELIDEQTLIDTTDHAAAMVGLHPETLSAEPNSAAYIHANHIAPNPLTSDLSDDIAAAGPAQPQITPGQPNGVTQGWATLRPFTDDQGRPLRFTEGSNAGLIQYNTEWEPTTIAIDAGQAIGSVTQTTKNDEMLGQDVTSMSSRPTQAAKAGSRASAAAPGASVLGPIWLRRDGVTTVIQDPTAVPRAAGTINYTMVPSTPQDGYNCTAAVVQNNGTPRVTLSFENTFLRWLGLFIQFSARGAVVPVSSLPASLTNGRGSPDNQSLHIGILTPEFTLFGIPVQSSTSTFAFDFPVSVADSATIIASGLGSGSHTFSSTEPLGIFMTTIFNLITPVIMIAAASAQELDPLIKLVVIPLVITSTAEFFTLLADLGSNIGYTNLLNILVRALSRSGVPIVLRIALAIAGAIATGAAVDAIPVAGQIIAAIGAAGAALELEETSIQVANSPWSYEYDLALTHNLSVTIKPDGNNTTTPKAANHYKVAALFDNGGTPHVFEGDLPQPVDQVVVTFTDVPLGGNVNVSASFSQVPIDPAQNEVLLGKTTTGLVQNTVDNLGNITIDQISFPIGPKTSYQHSQKTIRDGSGNHLWFATTTGPTTKASDIRCQLEGDLCDFYGITVRQGTSKAPGYLGYAWRGNSAGFINCGGSGQSDTGQLANLNTDTGNDGRNAQMGYATARCGLQRRPLLAYSLLGQGADNFYLDTTHNVLRRVVLDPPQFADPQGNQAWGAFNLDSTSLLLHPTGKLVSINQASHKLETLEPASRALSDDDAKVNRLALVHSGQGGRPGLMQQPVAAAISPDGVVLVLEQANNRIQAFDVGANPVPYFGKQTRPYFLNLTATSGGNAVYLDLAVEYTGFLYVLSYDNGTKIYRMDIYHPGQATTAPIATTMNVNAARLTVDYWRNVYTLNYEVLQSASGSAEPSVSLWIPTNGA